MKDFEKISSTAMVVSPHQDDAVISIGNHLVSTYSNIEVLNIFTKSRSHIIDGLADDIEEVSKIRAAEDKAVSKKYGLTFHNGDFDDSDIRGVLWDDKMTPIQESLQNDIRLWIAKQMANIAIKGADLYIPASIGLHPDHYSAINAMMHPSMRKIVEENGLRTFVYAEQPYYSETQEQRHLGQNQLNPDDRISISFSEEEKAGMLPLYPSQLSPERLSYLLNLGKEYIWKIAPENLSRFSKEILMRVNLSDNTVCSKKEWLDLTSKEYESNERKFINIGVVNSNGEALDIPIMIDCHNITDVGKITFARHAGVNTSDYMDFNGSEKYDKTALMELKNKLSHMNIGVLWLSGIKSDHPLIRALDNEKEKIGDEELFRGISTFQTICNPNGIEDWLMSIDIKRQRKIRKIQVRENRLEQYIEDNNLSIEFSIKNATRDSIDVFFNLQKDRATQTGKLDCLKDNHEYYNVILNSTDYNLLSISEIKVGEEVISSILIEDNKDNGSINIIAQGFDNKYSDYSPSYINIKKIIEYAHDNKYRYIDFLRGDEDYKKYFTDTEIYLYKYVNIISIFDTQKKDNIIRYIKSYEE